MNITREEFNRNYRENDPESKKLGASFLEWYGYHKLVTPLNEQKEKYKECDFEMEHLQDNKIVGIEVERRAGFWKVGIFPFNTITIPYRKSNNKSDLYIIINDGYDQIGITSVKNILKSPIIRKKTPREPNEKFFEVSKKYWKFFKKIDTKNNIWKEVVND